MKPVLKLLLTIVLTSSLIAVAQGLPPAFRSIGVDSGQANIPLTEVLSGGPPPQGVPAIGFGGDWQGAAPATKAPVFISPSEAAIWLGAREPVIALTINDETRGYPLQILTWHEIVNDTVGGVPVAVTFCPLCNSALSFDRRVPLSAGEAARVTARNPEVTLEPVALDFLQTYSLQRRTPVEVDHTLTVTFGVSGMLE